MTVTVVMHAARFSLVLRSLMKSGARPPTDTWPTARWLIRVMLLLILIHFAEVTVGRCAICGWDACRMPSRRSTLRSQLYVDWLRRSGVAEAVADLGGDRRLDRHSHVRIVRKPFLRAGDQDLRVAFGSKAKMDPSEKTPKVINL